MSTTPLTPLGRQTLIQIGNLLKTSEFVPTISQVLEIIQDLSSKNQNVQIQELVEAITKDVGLTSKIVIAANTIHFNHTGQRINTITEAIHQIGLSEIRSLVVTLLFLSPLQDPLRSEEIRNLSSIALMSGLIAQEAQPLSSLESPEQVLICSTLRYYGRLLISNFLSDQIGLIPDRLDPLELNDFYRQKIGVTPLELGYHISSSLNLSSSILKSMESVDDLPIHTLLKDLDGPYLILSSFSMAVCDILESKSTDIHLIDDKLKNLTKRYEGVLKIDIKKIKEILQKAQSSLESFQSLYHIPPFHTNFIDRLNCINKGAGATSLQSLQNQQPSSTDTFVLGLQEVTEMLTSERTTSTQVFQKIVRIVYEALRLRNCALLMRSDKDPSFTVQEALGQNAFEFRTEFKINLDGRDIFSACLLRADDVLLQNLTETKISLHLPPWHKKISAAGTAFLLPIKDHDQIIGVIYGEKTDIGSITFSPDILRNLKALRNQIRIARKLFKS